MIALLFGGIGLFLLGMSLMTEGLKTLAGDALRVSLMRFTGGPKRAVLSGAAITALVQSSSATTLATIGFVSAGMLTLQQAIGVIMGANLGTTSTAWIVSTVGLKFDVAAMALPLVGIGALARLMKLERLAALGTTLVGFGLVFVGIDFLQNGMSELTTRFDPSILPGATWVGRGILVLAGALMTVVMQSSSAAITTTLTAVNAGTLNLEQAAALAIGQNIGTTVTAALAAIGGTVVARRAAMAHILFNLVTGCVALVTLPLFMMVVLRLSHLVGEEDALGNNAKSMAGGAALSLTIFHTLFNAVGVALLLPATGHFARLLEKLIPERGSLLTKHLDPSLIPLSSVASEAALRSLKDIAATAFEAARASARHAPPSKHLLQESSQALERTQDFLGRLRTEKESTSVHARHLACIHAISHLQTLVAICREGSHPAQSTASPSDSETTQAQKLDAALKAAKAWLVLGQGDMPEPLLRDVAKQTAQWRVAERAKLLELTARQEVSPSVATDAIERLQRTERLAHAAWRAIFHLSESSNTQSPSAAPS